MRKSVFVRKKEKHRLRNRYGEKQWLVYWSEFIEKYKNVEIQENLLRM